MKKSITTLSLALVGAGILFSGSLSAGAQTLDNKTPMRQMGGQYSTMRQNRIDGFSCLTLSDDQLALLEQGYATLSEEDKAFYETYNHSSKVDLSADEIVKYETIRDQVHQFLDDETKALLDTRHDEQVATREERQATNQANREERQATNQANRGNGTGNQNKGMNRHQNVDCVIK